MLSLTLYRLRKEAGATLGNLELGAPVFRRFATLEPDPPVTPAGRYRLEYRWSGRFKRNMWFLTSVPGHEAIEVHNGNTKADTKGCILVGTRHGQLNGSPAVLNSRSALEQFLALMPPDGKATLDVVDIDE